MRHVIALSGGKDSTAMALRLKEVNPDVQYEYICTPTGDELPDMAAHFKNLERLLGPLKRLPNQSLRQLIEDWNALPNHRMRWCTRVMKIEPFIDYMEALPAGSVMYVGLRADESGRLGLVQPGAQFETQCPMQDWGWKLDDVNRYLACKGMKIPRRTDCARCFWNTLPEWYLLWKEHPGIYADAVSQEKEIGRTFRSDKRDTWPASLEGLASEFISGRIPKPRKRKSNPEKCRFCTM